MARFNSENNIDITKDSEAMESLKLEVKRAEQVLLVESQARIEIRNHHNCKRLPLTTTFTQLQELKRQLPTRTLDLVKNLLRDANIEKTEVQGIVFYWETGTYRESSTISQILSRYSKTTRTHKV
jgi:molecular chaperone DnaK (HSP70)